MSVGSVPYFYPGTDPKHLTKLLCEKDDRWLEEHGHCLGKRLDNFWKRDFSGRSSNYYIIKGSFSQYEDMK